MHTRKVSHRFAQLGLILSALLAAGSVFQPWLEWRHVELPVNVFGDSRSNTSLIGLLPAGNAGTKDFIAAPRPQGTFALVLGWTARAIVLVVCLSAALTLAKVRAKWIAIISLLPLVVAIMCSALFRWTLDEVLIHDGIGPIISRVYWTGPAMLIAGMAIEMLALFQIFALQRRSMSSR